MAINKKLIHFKTLAKFEEQSENILDTSIVFIQDAKQIWTHGTFYPCPYTKDEIDKLFVGSNITLSDYVEMESPINIADNDTVNEAFGKIEVYLSKLDDLNAILVDTNDVASDPTINDYISPSELTITLSDYATIAQLNTKQDTILDLAQIGLGNVDNTADSSKNVATAVKATQDASGNVITATYATKSELDTHTTEAKKYVDDQIKNLIGTAGETADTLGELATAIKNNEDVVALLETSVTGKVDKVDGKGLSTNDYTSDEKSKLEGIETGAQVNTLTGVKGSAEDTYRTGNVNITPANLGITVVNNTSDADKSVNYATSAGSATKATQDASGNVITTTYAKATAVASKQDKNLYFTDLSASSWVSDSTYSDFPYRCDISCSGVTSNMYAEVVFAMAEAQSGNYAPICETNSAVVSIWSKVNTTITVPTIKISK